MAGGRSWPVDPRDDADASSLVHRTVAQRALRVGASPNFAFSISQGIPWFEDCVPPVAYESDVLHERTLAVPDDAIKHQNC